MYFFAKSPMGKHAENRRQKYLNQFIQRQQRAVTSSLAQSSRTPQRVMATVTCRAAPITAIASTSRIVRASKAAIATVRRHTAPRAASHRSSATLRRSTRISVSTSALAPEHVASTIAQIALRDDYDPVVFLFCLNAIFLSVVINVVNYGMEKDEETGMLKMPEGGFGAVLDNTKRGMVEYMMAVPKQIKEIYEGSNPALESAIEELEDAKMAAYAARGTDAAEATAKRFMESRRKCVDLGLSPPSELLNPGLPSNTE